MPVVNTVMMDTMVNNMPSRPACSALKIFIPKPKPTTDICSNQCVALCVRRSKGFSIDCANINPSNNANGGDIAGNKHTISAIIKTDFRVFSLNDNE